MCLFQELGWAEAKDPKPSKQGLSKYILFVIFRISQEYC